MYYCHHSYCLCFYANKAVLPFYVFIFLAVCLWLAFLHSGLHATLAGVLLALFIPNQRLSSSQSVLHQVELRFQPIVAFAVLPIFALVNCAIPLSTQSIDQFLHPVPLAITVALFIGKPLGVFGLCAGALYFQLLPKPKYMSYGVLLGLSMLCGIGFTMSLFVGNLAFAENMQYMDGVKIGVLTGSLLSTLFGYFLILLTPNKPSK